MIRSRSNRGCFSLKQCQCPHCGKTGTLNSHSRLFGNDLRDPAGKILRGQRVFCSDRGQRGGCGRTVPLFLCGVLPRHTLNAALLWELLEKMNSGASLHLASQAFPLAAESIRNVWRKLRRHLDQLRATLCMAHAPPDSFQRLPLLQTVQHLRAVFEKDECPTASYQLRFQQAFLG